MLMLLAFASFVLQSVMDEYMTSRVYGSVYGRQRCSRRPHL